VAVEAEFRLPRTVVPAHYRLTIEPDLATGTFTGEVVIDVDVVEPVTEVVLNVLDLEVRSAVIADAAGRHDASVAIDEERERVILALETALRPGSSVVEIAFTGKLNEHLRGFYRSTFPDEDGNEHVIATTQFEPTDARRAFPCWDEPDLKATFEVTLVIEEGLLAVSNAAEVAREPRGDGKVAVHFGRTMRMSTYLVAFVVGDLVVTDPVDVDGVPLRVVHRPGQEGLTGHALELGAHALRYFSGYYGIPYPADKLDMIAIPDFAFGAMENLGAITFRESALLVDRERATQAELMRVADVIAHEIAHMWFGDLVTMRWWNGIWLNEAFATFAEMKCVDAYRPDWKRWLTFAASRSASMETDATAVTRPIEFPVASPQDADAMFDILTYQKGSSVLRMLERYLGEERFRRGVAGYLRRHLHGNTEAADLWAALEEAGDAPVGEIMNGWIFRGGFPLVEVSGGPNDYTISQRRFRYLEDGDGTWQVPLLLRSDAGELRHLLTGVEETVEAGPHLVANAGGDGFYRVRYVGSLADDVVERLGDLEGPERFAVVADAWAFVLRGDEPAAAYLRLVAGRADEDEPDIWNRMLGGLGGLDRIADDEARVLLQKFVRDLVSAQVARLGWEPADGETDEVRRLRGVIVRSLGTLGADEEAIARARKLLVDAEEDPGSIDAEVADAALAIVAYHGSAADFDHFVERSHAASTPQDVVKYLRAAASVPVVGTAERLFRMCLDGDVRSQDAYWVLAVLLGNRVTGPRVWELMKADWEQMLAVVPPVTGRRVLDLIPYRSEPEVAADIESWLGAHPIPAAGRYVDQQVELMKVRLGLRSRERPRLAAALR